MKKTYEAPSIEKIAFQYRDQVVAASNVRCVVSGQYSHYTDEAQCHPDNVGSNYTRE